MSEPQHILIIKTSAAGDVVRTTSILPFLRGHQVSWITDESCIPLFDEHSPETLSVYPLQHYPPQLLEQKFNLVISLEEDEFCARLASAFITDQLTGIFWDDGIAYTKNSSPWFDMSLVSKLGKEAADILKKANQKSYQQFLFEMIGAEFSGETYTIYQPGIRRQPKLIGLEKTAGHRWPNKAWFGFDELADALLKLGYTVVFFERQKLLRDYLRAIDTCSLLVCGDTLGMHLALAFKKPTIGIFTCTSPAEIHDYALLKKMISPSLHEFYYSTQFDPAATEAISMPEILAAVLSHWAANYPANGQTMENISSSVVQ